MSAIVANHLTKRYGKTLAVDALDLEVPPGDVFGVLGSVLCLPVIDGPRRFDFCVFLSVPPPEDFTACLLPDPYGAGRDFRVVCLTGELPTVFVSVLFCCCFR